MEKIYFDKDIRIEKNCACIGHFDGVHRGHQQLIQKTIELANLKGLKKYAITFNPDPEEVIFKKKVEHICSFNERIKLFERFGLDGVIIVPFNEETMKMDVDVFKKEILDKLNIDTLVCGFDYSYGYKGKGNYKTLKKQGVNVFMVEEFKYYGKKISSTRIKKEINKGNYKFVEKLLGHEYKQSRIIY